MVDNATDGGEDRRGALARNADRKESVEGANGRTRFELYLVPEPNGTKYLVFVLMADGTLHHVATFDTAALDDPEGAGSTFADHVRNGDG